MKKNLFLLTVAAAMLWSCSGNKNSGQIEIKGDTSIAFVDSVPADLKKIDLKSAVIHMKSSTFGMTQQIVMYMDDYGSKQLTEVSQEMMGVKVRQCTLSDSLYVYMYNPDDKTGKRSLVDKKNPNNIHFNAITKEMAREFHIKKNGTAVILGRTCDVYTMEIALEKMKGTYYVWKGITLKTDSEVGGISISMEATKIEENVAIPPEKFEIPKDIKFEEVAEIAK